MQEIVDRLQRKAEDLMKENEKLKSDRQMRKQQQYPGGALSKFGGAQAFGQHIIGKA